MKNIAVLNWLEVQSVGIQALVILAFIIFLNMGSRIVLNFLMKKYREDSKNWPAAVVSAVQVPLRYIIGLVGLALLSFLTADQLNSSAAFFIYRGIIIALILCIAWFFIRFIRRAERMVALSLNKKSDRRGLRDKGTLRAISKVLEVIVVIIAFLVVLSFMNISISGLVTFGGLSAAAIALSARDMLGNFLGGTMIYLDRPFLVGDLIFSPDQDIEGFVENIGWRLTTIRRLDKRCLYIPNGAFNTISVINSSQMTHRLINMTIGIRYSDIQLAHKIILDIRAFLIAHPEVDPTCHLLVNLDSFSESSVNILVYALIKTTEWEAFRKIQDEIMLAVIGVIKRDGAEVPFPSITLHLPENVKTHS